MNPPSINRRAFCLALGTSILGASCAGHGEPTETAQDGLARILRLKPAEVPWLGDLNAAQQRELYTALTTAGGSVSRSTVDLLMKVIGRRERLFAYVGYPPLPNRLSACDGLLRE